MKHTRNFMWGLWMLALECASIVLVVSGWIGLSEQNHYGAALLILGATALVHYTFDQNRERKRHWWQVMGLVAGILILAVGFAANYGEAYLEESFGNVSFGTMLYHMNTDLTGTNLSTFSQVFITLAVILAVTAIAAVVLDLILRKLGRHRGFSWFLICLGIVLTCHAGDRLYVHFDVEQYLANSKSMSSIYEDYYVDAREVQLNFPEQKRNLIYIFLESMETTYADVEHGGAATEANYIPELTEFAGEGFDFSGEDALNGFYMVPGADFTAGAMV